MFTKLIAALAMLALMGFRVEAQETDLQRIADALDVSTTKTFQFTGNGTMYSLGQSTSPAAAWPRQFVKSMTRVYDFTARRCATKSCVWRGDPDNWARAANGHIGQWAHAWNRPVKISCRGSGRPTIVLIKFLLAARPSARGVCQ